MHVGAILGGAPGWVYVLLAALVVLGVRRLRTREVPVAVALIPVVAFLAWSIVGASMFAGAAGPGLAALAWVGGVAVGVASAAILADAPGVRLPGGRVRQPGSPLPLILYLGVFVARFACGAWAALSPGQAILAGAVGLAIGAAMTGRLVSAILRWRPVAASVAA